MKYGVLFSIVLIILSGAFVYFEFAGSVSVPGSSARDASGGDGHARELPRTDTGVSGVTSSGSREATAATEAGEARDTLVTGSPEETMKEETPEMQSTHNTEPASAQARASMLVAGGCFWCVEADLEKLPGVLEVVSGYAGGTTENPTYDDYAAGGHREVVEVTYNPTVVSYREILIYAIKHMDPTDPDGSFYDRGVEYAPAIYYENESEKEIAESTVAAIDELEVYDKPLALAIEERPTFWRAEDYHQDYYKGLTSLKYTYYRNASGRDDFIEEHWGNDTGPTLPNETTPYDVSQWQGFEKPSEDTLRASLTTMQYQVTQNEATEPAYDNEYWDNKEDGIYVDIVSGEPLYSSTDKFDSGTGWPSFTKPIYPDAVTEHADYTLIVPRTEVRSRFADSHLGHIFTDAPAELGGIRHCINSAALRFVPREEMEEQGYGQFLTLFE